MSASLLEHFSSLEDLRVERNRRHAFVVSRLTPKGFGECFRNWTQAVAGVTADEIIAVDGKTARGSRDRARGRRALHMVSA